MELLSYYIRYLTALCEGSLTVPGLESEKTDPMEKAMDLQQIIAALGMPEFVRRCAAVTGERIPPEVYDSFDPALLRQLAQNAVASGKAETAAPSDPAAPAAEPASPENEEPPAEAKQNAYEAMLDCLMLEDALMQYLIEVLKTEDELGFFRLSNVTVRRELKLHDFLFWFGTKELYAERDERACVTIMDAVFDRLAAEGKLELAAALLSGDRPTFEALRAEAEELRQVPAATWEWYERYYLSRYYPIRTILKLRGVRFPRPAGL